MDKFLILKDSFVVFIAIILIVVILFVDNIVLAWLIIGLLGLDGFYLSIKHWCLWRKGVKNKISLQERFLSFLASFMFLCLITGTGLFMMALVKEGETPVPEGEQPFKPIIGCELYVAKNGSKNNKDNHNPLKGFHLTVLAKNLTGYKNLIKIVSNSWIEGFYGSPRTDRADLEKYHEGLIVLSGSDGSEVFTKITNGDIETLDETIKWYKQLFGEDYYLELQRCADCDLMSNTSSNLMLEQQRVNAVLLQKAKEYGVKVVATNDVHYVAPEDLVVYNIQKCVVAGNTIDKFFKTDSHQFRWLRSTKEMCELFSDVPEAIANTIEIFDKVEFYDIRHAPIIPQIDIPNGFGNDRKDKKRRRIAMRY